MLSTALYACHEAAGGKFIEFAGYHMPVQYKDGILKEHLWVRQSAGLFDVSHMGQLTLEGPGVAEFLSYITPSSFVTLEPSKAKYTVLTNEQGGIIDDLIITRLNENTFFIVINAARKAVDLAWFRKHLPKTITLTELSDQALMALQGPKAESIMKSVFPHINVADQAYMTIQEAKLTDGTPIRISRSGYTGEDGFELSIPNSHAPAVWDALLHNDVVRPIGLGARDSLRLEMGYPLYGHDLNEQTTPVEAGLSWVMSKDHKDFIGAGPILAQRQSLPKVKRVGVRLLDKGVAREGSIIVSNDGKEIGTLTSGGFGPSVNKAIGQGYVPLSYSESGTPVKILLRGKSLSAEICSATFIKANTKK